MLQRWIGHLALKRHAIAIHFEGQIVENGVVRQQQKLVADFPN
jgi:hypothetical protein